MPEGLSPPLGYAFATEHGLQVEAGSIGRLGLRAIPKWRWLCVRKSCMTALLEERLRDFLAKNPQAGPQPRWKNNEVAGRMETTR